MNGVAAEQFAPADQPNRSDFPGSDALEWLVQSKTPVSFRLAAKLHRWAYSQEVNQQNEIQKAQTQVTR